MYAPQTVSEFVFASPVHHSEVPGPRRMCNFSCPAERPRVAPPASMELALCLVCADTVVPSKVLPRG
jgi:hypothetical protein